MPPTPDNTNFLRGAFFILRPFKVDLQFLNQYLGFRFRYPNIEGARNEKARNSKLVLSGVVCIYGVMLVHSIQFIYHDVRTRRHEY